MRLRPTPRASRSSRGFTIIEVLVVMLIIGILLAMGTWAIRSSARSGSLTAGIATANAYAGAIERFAGDHRGRYPDPPGSDDWPGGADAAGGPGSALLGERTSYLPKVPEAVQHGRVDFDQAGDARVLIEYRVTGDGFALAVSQDGEEVCAVGSGSLDGLDPCSTR